MKNHIFFTFLFAFLHLCFAACSNSELPVKDYFRFNQLGFYTSQEKIAVIDTLVSGEFYVKESISDKIVFKGIISDPRSSSFSNKKTVLLSFNELNSPGIYYLEIPKVAKSLPFEIKDTLLYDLGKASLKAFYYQRSGIAIESKYAGKWVRPEGHSDNKVLIHSSAATSKRPAGTSIISSKGWYDAGDYNKYIVNSGFTVGMLLSLYEDYPKYAKDISVNIPESKNNTPDLLDEIWWNLDWMLSMQDPTDGGVYHKLTTPSFEGMIKPSDCKQQRYVIEKSVTATLDFAASMAQGSRVFKSFDSDYPGASAKMLQAALKAFDWALKHPDALYNQQKMNEMYKPEVTTGGYEDRSSEDELFWAATELFISTGDAKFFKIIKQNSPDSFKLPVWSNVYGLGALSLIRHSRNLGTEGELIASLMGNQLVTYADSCLKGVELAPYAASYGRSKRDFFWGCNSDKASNQGIAFLYAYQLTKDKRYLSNALCNMEYLLGRNATGYCYITGFGTKSPHNPHHRLSASDEIEEPLPGFLVGGPNPGRQDKCEYPSDIPDESYVDLLPSYASNEVAINWQGMFTYFAMALDASFK